MKHCIFGRVPPSTTQHSFYKVKVVQYLYKMYEDYTGKTAFVTL